MKKIFLTLSLLVATVAMMAVPAKPGLWSVIKLKNGTEVRVQRVGDEYGHWLQDANGTCYVRNNDVYEQADRNAVVQKRQARLNAKAAKRKAIYASTSDGLGQKGTMSRGAVPSIGSYTIPVVMVQFNDLKFKSTTTVEKMDRYYNEEGYHDESGSVGSVRDYFKAQSGGQFVPTFQVVGIVTLSKSYKDYGGNDSNGNDKGIDNLPNDVISAAISQLGADFSQFVVPAGDEYHKEGVPLLAMFYAGKGEATEQSGAENYLWPCEWDDVEDPVGRGTYNGVHFNSFFIGNELIGSKLMGMSVFCHEFGHALGLPDFYVTDNSYSNDDPFGLWSIMDCGAYVDDECRAPMGYNAYEKSYMGWLELKEFGDAKEVTLQSPLGTAENSAYIIRNSSTETFIFENRQPGTWYSEQFGSGVMVSRIAYSYNQWNNNTLNNTKSKKRACILTADGSKLYYSAKSSNLYGNSKKSIGALKTYSSSTMDAKITDITKNSDGTITLTLNDSTTGGGGGDPVGPTGDYLFYESFDDCAGTGGNDNHWERTVASADFYSDNEGWSADALYGGDQCARFGSSKKLGKVTTPTIALTNETELTFRAAAWKDDGTTLKLSAEGAKVLFTPSQVTMKSAEWTSFTVKMSGAGNAKIVFTPAKRFFLDDVKVVDKTAVTGINDVQTVNHPADGKIYTLDGRFVGKDLNLLSRGIYIVDGKKVCK